MDNFWLAETSNKPISLTTWLAVNPLNLPYLSHVSLLAVSFFTMQWPGSFMSSQISAVPYLCCIVIPRLVQSIGGGFYVMAMPRVWFGCTSQHDIHFNVLSLEIGQKNYLNKFNCP